VTGFLKAPNHDRMSVGERVAAGAAVLDAKDPGWWRADVERAINLDMLDMLNGRLCVLGQRCPVEIWARRERPWMTPYVVQVGRMSGLPVDQGVWENAAGWVYAHGFAPNDDDFHHPRERLESEWKRVITERRAAA